MYAWIWRHLPFGLPGRLIGSLLLTGLAAALLWYVIFPWAEPLLPFDDVQVTQDGGIPGGEETTPVDGPASAEQPAPGDEHDLPYSTASNNPAPTSTRRR